MKTELEKKLLLELVGKQLKNGTWIEFLSRLPKNVKRRRVIKQVELDCPFNFTSRCSMGRCDCKPKKE